MVAPQRWEGLGGRKQGELVTDIVLLKRSLDHTLEDEG